MPRLTAWPFSCCPVNARVYDSSHHTGMLKPLDVLMVYLTRHHHLLRRGCRRFRVNWRLVVDDDLTVESIMHVHLLIAWRRYSVELLLLLLIFHHGNDLLLELGDLRLVLLLDLF